MQQQFTCRGKVYPYTLQRKQVKNVNMRVREDGSIYVSAPQQMPVRRVQEILEEYAPRLAKQSDENAQRYAQTRQNSAEDGSEFLYLGEKLRLQWAEKPCRTQRTGNTLTVFARSEEAADFARRQWMIQECMTLCRTANREVYQAFQQEGYAVPLARIEIKDMSSRWGSCTAKSGRISINFRLMQYPESCLYAVFYHEYTHFLHQNHSRAFYAVLEKLYPDYKQCDKILKGGHIA